MESFLPSEIGRLIYGYLSENNEELADLFLRSSSVMEECRIAKNSSRKFSAKVQGMTLVNILDQYSILCSLIFKQVTSSECIHQNVLNVLKKVLYTKVREYNEQLANELLAQNFSFAVSVPSDTTKPRRKADEVQAQNSNIVLSVPSDTTNPKRNKANHSINMSVIHDLSLNANSTVNDVNAIATCSVDNSIVAGQDVASMDVANGLAGNEPQNVNLSVEKPVHMEPMNVISLLEDSESSANSNQSNDVPDKSKEDPTERSVCTSLPSTLKISEDIPIETHTNVITPGKACTGANTKVELKLNGVKNQHCKSEVKNTVPNKSMILPNTKVSETKQSDDLHTPPEAEKSSRISQTVFENLTLNPHYRRESYITPMKELKKRRDDLQSTPRTVSINSFPPVQSVFDNATVEVACQENPAVKTIPNIIRPSNKADPSKIKLPKNTLPNQRKPPPVRKRKSDPKESTVKPAPKAASSNDKEMHLVIPNIVLDKGNFPSANIEKSVEATVNPAFEATLSNEKELQNITPIQAELPPIHNLKSNSKEPPIKTARKATSSKDIETQSADLCIVSNQDKTPSVRRQKLDLNEVSVKTALKTTPSNNKEKYFVENSHLQRPPPIIDAPWDSNLRIFAADALDSKTPKSTRKTPRKTPGKKKRESPLDINDNLRKRPKLDENAAKRPKRRSKGKADDLDKSTESQSSVNKDDNVNNTEFQLNQLPVAEPQLEIQPCLQPEEIPNISSTSTPLPAKNKNDSVELTAVDTIANILRTAAANVAKPQPSPDTTLVDEIDDENDDGIKLNLTMEPEVVLYVANLQSV